LTATPGENVTVSRTIPRIFTHVRKRPLAWTPQNIILTPHPTLPQIHAQILPLAKSTPHKFSVPSPAPIHDSPAHFAPPKLISLSPGGLYLLAYFPPSGLNPGDGAACIWQKGPEATLWDVRHVWSVARGNGIVCCKWLCNEREVRSLQTPNFEQRWTPNTINSVVHSVPGKRKTKSYSANGSPHQQLNIRSCNPIAQLCLVPAPTPQRRSTTLSQ
jgi:hypothetical protein